MVEKSPKALRVFRFARRSFISGTEKVEFAVADARRALPDIDQSLLVAIDKRLEQDSPHQRENGSVRADAERQREHHGDGEPSRPRERAEGDFKSPK